MIQQKTRPKRKPNAPRIAAMETRLGKMSGLFRKGLNRKEVTGIDKKSPEGI